MRTRIVVADQSTVRIYELAARGEPLALIRELQNPDAHLYERELVSWPGPNPRPAARK